MPPQAAKDLARTAAPPAGDQDREKGQAGQRGGHPQRPPRKRGGGRGEEDRRAHGERTGSDRGGKARMHAKGRPEPRKGEGGEEAQESRRGNDDRRLTGPKRRGTAKRERGNRQR